MIEHLGAKGWEIGDLDEISPGQPFRLRGTQTGRFCLTRNVDCQLGSRVHFLGRRRPEVYEEQTSWKLEMGPADVAKAWRANYESAAEHVDHVRAEGLMLKLDEDAFWGKYGDEAALSAIAVLVDEGPPLRRRGSSMTRLTKVSTGKVLLAPLLEGPSMCSPLGHGRHLQGTQEIPPFPR